MKKTTDELLNILKQKPDIHKFVDENQTEFLQKSLSDQLSDMIAEKQLKKSQIIQKANIDRVYGYQIINGTRMPSRDKLLQLCLGMDLTLIEVQKILKNANMPLLYPRNKRDSIIIHGIYHNLSVIDLNLQLDQAEELPFE